MMPRKRTHRLKRWREKQEFQPKKKTVKIKTPRWPQKSRNIPSSLLNRPHSTFSKSSNVKLNCYFYLFLFFSFFPFFFKYNKWNPRETRVNLSDLSLFLLCQSFLFLYSTKQNFFLFPQVAFKRRRLTFFLLFFWFFLVSHLIFSSGLDFIFLFLSSECVLN